MKIIKATDIRDSKGTYLIYGNPGVGKTTAIKFLPGKKLVVDIDKSSVVLRGEENIDVLEIDSYKIWESWIEAVKFIIKNAKDYDFVVVDNVTELFRSILAQQGREGRNNRVPSMADYQRSDFVIMDSFRAIKNAGANVVFTAWETSDKWETEGGQMFNRAIPDIRRTILNNFLGLCDVVGRLIINKTDEEIKRGFILQPSMDVYAKNRLDERKGCLQSEFIRLPKGVDKKD